MFAMTLLLLILKQVTSEMEGMIVGGGYAKIENFPHSAFLAINCVTASDVENYSCGSSIVNQMILLTAAHCFEDCLASSSIAVGVAVEKKHSSLTHLVQSFTLHPKFNGKQVVNDIALAKLSYNLDFNDKVKRVVLTTSPPYNEVAEVAGWGIVDEGENLGTMYLKSAKQKIWKRKDCTAVLNKLLKGTICARGIKTASQYGYPAAVLMFAKTEKESKMEPFIVGGSYAKIEDFAHVAFLAIACEKETGTEHFSCGSSIVNQMIVLTAAHCLEECRTTSSVLVSVGTVERKSPFTHEISLFVIHPEYDAETVVNDIALAALTSSLKLNSKIKRVAIMKNPPYHEISSVAGWGLIDEHRNSAAQYLKQAKQMYVNRRHCSKLLKELKKGTFCVSGIEKMKDFGYAASGDSGSAIVVRGYIQIGLVSYKIPQLSSSVIGATDVGYFYDWIQDNAQHLFCQATDTK